MGAVRHLGFDPKWNLNTARPPWTHIASHTKFQQIQQSAADLLMIQQISLVSFQ